MNAYLCVPSKLLTAVLEDHRSSRVYLKPYGAGEFSVVCYLAGSRVLVADNLRWDRARPPNMFHKRTVGEAG